MNNRWTKENFIQLAGIVALTLIFLLVAAANLPDFFPVLADDGWIMSASDKLASIGVFGSDMYAGFFNADRHYFIALPVYHLLQAASFKLFDLGVFQARLPNIFSALLLIWVTAGLANRHYGRKTALLTAALLVFWRSDLTATEPRVPLLATAHSGRYDITAALLVWAAVLLLDHFNSHPRLRIALLMGLTAALATLTQFFGIFVLLPITLIFWHKWGKGLLKQKPVLLFTAAFLLTILPYAAYSLAHLEDFIGQSTLKGERTHFTDPAFYLENIRTEINRYNPLLQRQYSTLSGGGEPFRPFGPWLLSLTIITAVIYLAIFLRRKQANELKVLWSVPWLSLICLGLGLTLFDQTKAPIYAILLLPGISLTLAVLSRKTARWFWRLKRPLTQRLALALPLALLLALIILEGANSHRRMVQLALSTTPYQTIGDRLQSTLGSADTGAAVLGAERWWPALKGYNYLSLPNLWAQWAISEQDGHSPLFAEQAIAVSAEFIIINDNIIGDLTRYPERLQTQFQNYLAACGNLVDSWDDYSYGEIQVYRLNDSPDC